MTTAQNVISTAKHEVGYREKATNHQKYSSAVPGLEWSQNQPWCMTFVVWAFHECDAGNLVPLTAGCEIGASWFRQRGLFSPTPHVGDLVFYGPDGGTHVEIVTEVNARQIRTVGGNTSGSLKGRYYAGDGVYEKWIDRDESRIYGYGHPAYGGDDTRAHSEGDADEILRKGSTGPAVEAWQKDLNKHGAGLVVDGDFGDQTDASTRAFQRAMKLDADGEVGPKTRAAMKSAPQGNQGDAGADSATGTPGTLKSAQRTVVIEPGSSNVEVVEDLQRLLRGNGYELDVDGEFGAATLAAVKAFQKKMKITVDGVVGPQTWEKLYA
ncbi:hypothetical protein Pth03_67440 [Planotetraspora thailandica]|uniref:CHAP domain-containing protein n=2 Tax=Planotetraspora thailandica TaxID=487172 RepID=A0A8J3Y033_9ACTN|nr:hypothetical protein Pth03_67440 [Planotetraspora thailandica]